MEKVSINVKKMDSGYILTIDGKSSAKERTEGVKGSIDKLIAEKILNKIDGLAIDEVEINLEITIKNKER